MGWAIRRADGTYRGWNSRAQDDALASGEVYEERETAPAITRPPITDAEKDANASASLDGFVLLKAIVIWQAQLHGKTPQEARSEIMAIYRGLVT